MRSYSFLCWGVLLESSDAPFFVLTFIHSDTEKGFWASSGLMICLPHIFLSRTGRVIDD